MSYEIFSSRNPRIFLALAVVIVAVAVGVFVSAATTSVEEAVLSANQEFYRAFAERDIAGMEAVWATGKPVAVIHPGWMGLEGRDAVMLSWRKILENPASPAIRISNASVYVYGDVAFVICYELIGDGVLIATNILVLQDGNWKMVHHQAGTTLGLPKQSTDKTI